MKWYKVAMSPEDVAAYKGKGLQDAFAELFVDIGGPPDAGMFGSLEVTGDYFFSPGAVRIAGPLIEGFAGFECPAPTRSEVAILVAHSDAEDIPFAPEK